MTATVRPNVRVPWRDVHGILLLDKPLGLSSNQALQRVRRLFQAKKAGHTGSLDPLATGWLPLCFGRATRQTTQWLEASKHYRVECELGVRTASGDREGVVLERRTVEPAMVERLPEVVASFLGAQSQIPSMYSALKHQGKPLYELARKGVTVERAPRSIEIFSIQNVGYDAKSCVLTLQVHSSKGTYIRTLVEDLGERLGCGAHVSALCRNRIEGFPIHRAYTLEELEQEGTSNGLPGLDAFLFAPNL